ncbi:MAG: hypothetical protein ACPG5B_08165 [Chitinophagales bacterium]
MDTRVYHNIEGLVNFPTIRLSELSVFENMVDKYQPECIFVATTTRTTKAGEKDLIGRKKIVEKTNTSLSFQHNGMVYSVDSANFRTLEDQKDGALKGFEDGTDYYAAKEGNFIDSEEYQHCQTAGFEDRVEYLKAQRIGFVGSIEKLETAVANGKLNDAEYKKIKTLQTDSQVYNFAKNFGYDNYDEFENALASGFVKAEATDYREALEKGFDSSKTFYKAKKGSFTDLTEFQQAQTVGIGDKQDWSRYVELNNIKETCGFRSIEQAHLFELLNNLEENKKVSITRMWEMLKSNQKNANNSKSDVSWLDRPIMQIFGGGSKLPDWYSTSFKDMVEVKVFLISNENIGRIGLYDADGEVFERKIMKPIVAEIEELEMLDEETSEE